MTYWDRALNFMREDMTGWDIAGWMSGVGFAWATLGIGFWMLLIGASAGWIIVGMGAFFVGALFTAIPLSLHIRVSEAQQREKMWKPIPRGTLPKNYKDFSLTNNKVNKPQNATTEVINLKLAECIRWLNDKNKKNYFTPRGISKIQARLTKVSSSIAAYNTRFANADPSPADITRLAGKIDKLLKGIASNGEKYKANWVFEKCQNRVNWDKDKDNFGSIIDDPHKAKTDRLARARQAREARARREARTAKAARATQTRPNPVYRTHSLHTRERAGSEPIISYQPRTGRVASRNRAESAPAVISPDKIPSQRKPRSPTSPTGSRRSSGSDRSLGGV